MQLIVTTRDAPSLRSKCEPPTEIIWNTATFELLPLLYQYTSERQPYQYTSERQAAAS